MNESIARGLAYLGRLNLAPFTPVTTAQITIPANLNSTIFDAIVESIKAVNKDFKELDSDVGAIASQVGFNVETGKFDKQPNGKRIPSLAKLADDHASLAQRVKDLGKANQELVARLDKPATQVRKMMDKPATKRPSRRPQLARPSAGVT
ncbi:hypothetical protein MN608_11727 [Microdochium nivale]|nr:hypothetical protein MN608_11727 [Microdochium nivale]